MADENQEENQEDEGQEGKEDRIKNLQAEFSRKMKSTDEKLDKAVATNEQLLIQMQLMNQNQQKPKVTEKAEDLATMMYEDPERYTQIVEDRAAKKVRQENDAERAIERTNNETLHQIYSEFPEAKDETNPMTQRTLELFNASGDKSATALHRFAYQAAAEQGIKPRSKRTSDTDDFSLGGGASGGPRKNRKRSPDLHPKTLENASLMGLDISDPKVIERLKEYSKKFEKQIDKEEGL